MLGSKNVLDMLKSEKIDTENHIENTTEKNNSTDTKNRNPPTTAAGRSATSLPLEPLSSNEVLPSGCQKNTTATPFVSKDTSLRFPSSADLSACERGNHVVS